MPPSNRARQYGGGRGGFDLGGLLLGAFGNGGAEELNPYFGGDEESIRAETGDYKSRIDTENPYKRGNWANRMLGGDGSGKNAEFQIQQKVMQQQQQFQQDLEKLRLANDLMQLGAKTEAEKLLKTVDLENAKSLLAGEYELKGEQAKLESALNTEGSKDILGYEYGLKKGQSELESGLKIKENKKAAKQTRKTDTNKFNLEDRNNLNATSRGFNAKLGMFPDTVPTDEMRQLGNEAGLSTLRTAPKFTEADLLFKENQAKAAGYRDLGASGTMDITKPNLPVTYFDRGSEATLNSPAIPASVIRQNTQMLPPSEPTLGVPVSPDLSNPPAVTTRGAGGKMNITPKPAAGTPVSLPEDYDTVEKRLRARRTIGELQDLLFNSQQGGQWPPR